MQGEKKNKIHLLLHLFRPNSRNITVIMLKVVLRFPALIHFESLLGSVEFNVSAKQFYDQILRIQQTFYYKIELILIKVLIIHYNHQFKNIYIISLMYQLITFLFIKDLFSLFIFSISY